jgi:Photosynthetic reaction centre cytochrome C subunit
MRFLVTMLLVLVPLGAQDAPPPKKGGGPPKNLKVLTVEELRSGVVGKYVAALGVGQSGGCNYCHVQDKSSDENPKKDVARMMITMVKDINSKIASASGGTAKEFVSCYTCHRGKTEPEIAPAAQ